MAGTALKAFQPALYAALAGSETVQTALGASTSSPVVYDYVPGNQVYPYLVISQLREEQEDTIGKTGKRITVYLETWSQYLGYSQIHDVHDAIIELLDRHALSVTGWSLTTGVHVSSQVGRLPDGVTRLGTLEISWRAWTA